MRSPVISLSYGGLAEIKEIVEHLVLEYCLLHKKKKLFIFCRYVSQKLYPFTVSAFGANSFIGAIIAPCALKISIPLFLFYPIKFEKRVLSYF
jgi:hypothetical protein